jgi:hypothetical protein
MQLGRLEQTHVVRPLLLTHQVVDVPGRVLPKTGIEGDNDVEALTRIEKRFPALLSCGSLKEGAGRDSEGRQSVLLRNDDLPARKSSM